MRRFASKYRTLGRWLVALVLLALAIRLLWSNPDPLRRALAIPPEILLGLCVLAGLNQLFMSWRLGLAVAQCGGRGVGGGAWFRLTSVGQFLNMFIPQLGNVYRAVVLKRDHGIPYMSYASGLFAFVWLDLLTALAIAACAIALFDAGLQLAGLPALLWLGASLLGLLAAPFVLLRTVRILPLRAGSVSQLQTRVETLLALTSAATKDAGFLVRFLGLNLITAAGQVTLLGIALRATGATVGLSPLVLFQVLFKFSNQVVITPGNLGITELGYGVLAHASQCTLEQGIAAALLVRTVLTFSVIVLGVISGGGPFLFGGRQTLQTTRLE